jgi:hypothetical protein
MTLKAALDALHHDVGVWDQVSRVTDLAGQEAQGLQLSENDLSWAANHTALLGTYAEAQARTAMLLGEATEVFSKLSTALDQVAAAYEASDERAAADLKGVWDLRE